MATDQEIMKRLSDYLIRKRVEEGFRRGRPVSQSQMAHILKIAQGSLSQYELGNRLPDEENRHKLATYFGIEIYDLLEQPRSLPADKMLMAIVEAWGSLTPDTRKRFANLIQDEALAQRERTQLPKNAAVNTD